MNLQKIEIHFQEVDELFSEINIAVSSGHSLSDQLGIINFDSLKTYRSFMTAKKVDILVAISRLRPQSVYALAKILERRPQHVAADCRSLETHGFIKMVEVVGSVRREIQPELIFEYDIVVVDDVNITPIAISEKSGRILQEAIA